VAIQNKILHTEIGLEKVLVDAGAIKVRKFNSFNAVNNKLFLIRNHI